MKHLQNSFIIISTVYHFSGHTRTCILNGKQETIQVYFQEVVCFDRKNCKQIFQVFKQMYMRTFYQH